MRQIFFSLGILGLETIRARGIPLTDRLTDLKPTEGLQDFEFLWGSRNYSSYVFSYWSLSRYIFWVFSRCALLLSFRFGVAYTQGLLSLCSLARLSCRWVFQVLNADIILPSVPSNNLPARDGMTDIPALLGMVHMRDARVM
jgi:hypothetical protein